MNCLTKIVPCEGEKKPLKAMYRYELANMAGVSYSTFYRWLKKNEPELLTIGYIPESKLLAPRVVRWICENYGIDY